MQTKKILITLNAFEDEQFNYKAEVRCDPQVVTGPQELVIMRVCEPWVVRISLGLFWDVKKKSCVTACRSITLVVNLGSHPATLWRRLSLAAYLVHVYLYLPIMTAYDHVLHVKSDEKKNDTGTPVGVDLPR